MIEKSDESSSPVDYLKLNDKVSPILGPLDEVIMKHSKSTAAKKEKVADMNGTGNAIKIGEGQLFQTMPLNSPTTI